jgi:hypothetical protein
MATIADILKAPGKISMWLDDMRPAPDGWVLVTTAWEAIALIKAGKVARASLDHDLGLCTPCARREEAFKDLTGYRVARNCTCMTGYKLCLWMAENEKWPDEKPIVHSANPVGAFAMRQIIDRYFPAEPALPDLATALPAAIAKLLRKRKP